MDKCSWFIFYDYNLIQFLRWCEVWRWFRWFRIHRFDPPNWPSAEDFSRYLSSEGKSAPSYSEYLNFQKFTKGALWSHFRLALSARTFQEMMGLVDWFSDCVCWAVAELMSEFIWLHETFQCQPFFCVAPDIGESLSTRSSRPRTVFASPFRTTWKQGMHYSISNHHGVVSPNSCRVTFELSLLGRAVNLRINQLHRPNFHRWTLEEWAWSMSVCLDMPVRPFLDLKQGFGILKLLFLIH